MHRSWTYLSLITRALHCGLATPIEIRILPMDAHVSAAAFSVGKRGEETGIYVRRRSPQSHPAYPR